MVIDARPQREFTQEEVLRLLAAMEAARGVPCNRCPHGKHWRPADGCERFDICLEEMQALRNYGKAGN